MDFDPRNLPGLAFYMDEARLFQGGVCYRAVRTSLGAVLVVRTDSHCTLDPVHGTEAMEAFRRFNNAAAGTAP